MAGEAEAPAISLPEGSGEILCGSLSHKTPASVSARHRGRLKRSFCCVPIIAFKNSSILPSLEKKPTTGSSLCAIESIGSRARMPESCRTLRSPHPVPGYYGNGCRHNFVPSDLSPKILVPPGFPSSSALALMICKPAPYRSHKEFGSQDSSDCYPPRKTSGPAPSVDEQLDFILQTRKLVFPLRSSPGRGVKDG